MAQAVYGKKPQLLMCWKLKLQLIGKLTPNTWIICLIWWLALIDTEKKNFGETEFVYNFSYSIQNVYDQITKNLYFWNETMFLGFFLNF